MRRDHAQHARRLRNVLVRQLVEEHREAVLVDLASGEPAAAPGHPRGPDHLATVSRVEDEALVVLGLDQPAPSMISALLVAAHLLDVDRVPEPVHGTSFSSAPSARPTSNAMATMLAAFPGERRLAMNPDDADGPTSDT